MAGIGFSMRLLARKGDLVSMTTAYGYSMFLVAGPWIFTVFALLGMSAAWRSNLSWEAIQTFRSIVVYNFCFTLILTGPVVLLSTRYVADQIYKDDTAFVPFVFAVTLGAVACLTLLVGGIFWIGFAQLDPVLKLLGAINFGLSSALWVTLPFIAILEKFRAIAFAFFFGCIAAIATTIFLAPLLNALLLLLTFNVALALILLTILIQVAHEFPGDVVIDADWLKFLRTRWELAFIGLFYYLGIWIDKIIMWHAPVDDRVIIGDVLSTLPIYDATMFKAQLLAIPAFVIFFVHIETRFYELFQSLYRSFEAHATRRTIEQRVAAVSEFALQQVLMLLFYMAIVVMVLIISLPITYKLLTLSEIQLGMFRVALLGTSFHTSFLIVMIFLLYFDLRRLVLWLTFAFCILNGASTIALLPLGLPYYGVGYMVAGAICLILGAAILLKELPWLAFHGFITNNSSLK